MPDISLEWGGDLAVSAIGDLTLVAGAELGRQRVLRRLLTNQGDYIWQPSYGAGLAAFVGQPVAAARIRAVVLAQMRRERVVARAPEPVVDVREAGDGVVAVDIRYADSASGETQILSFRLGEG